MKKIVKRITTAVIAAAMVLSMPMAAMADNAHFTFTDIDEPQPDLYVAKSVSSAVDGYSVPEGATFTFVLKWDQDGDGYLEFAENEIYYVYNADGTQVYNDANDSYIFRTSSTGRFTLQDGQYARFEWAGEVNYEVTEDVSDPYINTSGDKTGTIDASGTYVTFENLYVPPEDTGGGDGGGSGATTQIIVRKDISWADGYETPDFSDTEFAFTVKVDGALYTNKAYDIYDAGMTTKIDSGRTDSDGVFTMTGSTTVVFDDVDVGVDYEIEETGSVSGWRATDKTSYAGSTTSPMVYCYFNNEGADFIVTKDRADGATGQEFSFIFSNNEGNPMPDITYYIYDAKGNLTGSGITDEEGKFTIHAGEQVIFTGIPDGMEYKITEEDDSGYLVTADGNAGEDEVTDMEDYDSIDTHSFVNEQLTDITITKYGSTLNTEKNLLAGAEFTAYVLNEETGEYEEYGVLTTGEDGTLTFTLPAGTYRIVETKTPAGYIAMGDPIEVTLPYASANEVTGAVYSERDGVYYVYDLNYTVDNTATLIMPNTGGWTWIIILCIIAGAFVVGMVLRQYIKNHPRNKGVLA